MFIRICYLRCTILCTYNEKKKNCNVFLKNNNNVIKLYYRYGYNIKKKNNTNIVEEILKIMSTQTRIDMVTIVLRDF